MDCAVRWIVTGLLAVAFTASLTGCSEPAAPIEQKPRPVKLFTVSDPGTRAFLLQSLDLKAEPPRWKLNLAVLGAEMEAILDWPGTPGVFDGPALFVHGALSNYVKPEHEPAIRAQFPRAKFAVIESAGHWLHAERPREFEAVVAEFLT